LGKKECFDKKTSGTGSLEGKERKRKEMTQKRRKKGMR